MSQSTCHSAGARPTNVCTLADIVHRYGDALRSAHRLLSSHRKVLQAIASCRTAALGGHRERCAQCGFERYAYNSCRNRHCPQCQTFAKERWLEQRRAELLPVPYFHNVFTLPHELNTLILCQETNQRALLNLLFQAAADTLLTFGRNDLGGTPGVTMVLHTWDQQLRPHFHVHCLVTGGALSDDGQHWQPAQRRFLFAVRALSRVFRGKFLDGLRRLYDDGALVLPAAVRSVAPLIKPEAFYALLSSLRRRDWVVYCKAPLAGPHKLLDYLGRYTHRVALSNSRLLSCDDGQVSFHYRDRADGDTRKIATLAADEFLRRFLCHVLPSGFMRIRHYGVNANCRKQQLLPRCRQLLKAPPPTPPQKRTTVEWLLELGIDVTRCPQCSHAPLERIGLPPLRLLRRPLATPPREDTS